MGISLKTKSRIYRYTGIYLASKEEQAHLELPTTKLQIFKIHGSETWGEPSLDDAKGIATGLWQVEHGFYRPICFLKYEYPNFVGKTIAWLVELYFAIRNDIRGHYGRR